MYVIGYPLESAAEILNALLVIYTFIIMAAVVISWTSPDPLNPIVRILRNLTEPVFERVRRYVPLVGGLDLTPVVVIIGITFFRTGVLHVISRFAHEISQ